MTCTLYILVTADFYECFVPVQ